MMTEPSGLLDPMIARAYHGRVSSRLDELARATPATRDRYVDFLRAASIVAVKSCPASTVESNTCSFVPPAT